MGTNGGISITTTIVIATTTSIVTAVSKSILTIHSYCRKTNLCGFQNILQTSMYTDMPYC